jgi:CheY-like chemotaxis protein
VGNGKRVPNSPGHHEFVYQRRACHIKLIKMMLEKLGYAVTTRASSVQALESFRTAPGKFDLVITDMTMPDMTGDKLAVELKKIWWSS